MNFRETLNLLMKHGKVKDFELLPQDSGLNFSFLVNGKNGIRKIFMRFIRMGERTATTESPLLRVDEYTGLRHARETHFDYGDYTKGVVTIKHQTDGTRKLRYTETDHVDPQHPVSIATCEKNSADEYTTPTRKEVRVGGKIAHDRVPTFNLFNI